MKCLIIVLITLAVAFQAQATPTVSQTRVMPTGQLSFIPNQGQWNHRAEYYANGNGPAIWLVADGAYFQMFRQLDTGGPEGRLEESPSKHSSNLASRRRESYVVRQQFIGGDPAIILPEKKQTFYVNYFLGKNSSLWRPRVPTFQSVVYHGMYPGIDVKYHGDGSHLIYDLILSPGADLSNVRVRYEGADSIRLNESGELVVATPWGEFAEKKLFVYQGIASPEFAIEATYVLFDKNTYGFELLAKPSNPFAAVVLDPTLVYGTFLGGSAQEIAGRIAVNSVGAAHVIGSTYSSNFPLQAAYDTLFGGFLDCYVSKLDPGGTLEFSTFIGGFSSEGHAITVNFQNRIYITGYKATADFPVTSNAVDSTSVNSSFATCLSQAGDSIIYSTYIGGNNTTIGYAIAVDLAGDIYVAGQTADVSFFTPGAVDSVVAGGFDGFVTKIEVGNPAFVYSTYLGGNGIDRVNGMAVDAAGNAFVAGTTQSSDFPLASAFDPTFAGASDAFVSKISPSGTSLVYSTYLGGTGAEDGSDLALDNLGRAHVTGLTGSLNFPLSNPLDATFASVDAYVSILSASGSTLAFSTFLGGTSSDRTRSIALDTVGNIYVTGETFSPDFPLANADDSTKGGDNDVFLARYGAGGSTYDYGSYFGNTGSGDERPTGIAVSAQGIVHVTGTVETSGFSGLTANGIDTSYNGGFTDAFVMRASLGDEDGDGILDPLDNCPTVPNPGQEDADLDSIGDACDPGFVIDTVLTDDIFFIGKGDFDRDNYLDFVTSGFVNASDGRLSIIYGDPATLLETPQELISLTNVAVDVDYVNSDTLLDIVARSSSKVYQILNQGGRVYTIDSFTVPSPEFPGETDPPVSTFRAGGAALETKDIPLIGDLPRYPYVQEVTTIDRAGERSRTKSLSQPPSDAGITTAYLNAPDAILDLVVTPNKYMLGLGTNFAAPITLGFTFEAVDAADIDNDGDDDLAVISGTTFRIYRNSGVPAFTQTFSTAAAIRTFDYATVKTEIDLNGDRFPDFGVVTGTENSTTDTGTIRIFLGNGTGGVIDSSTFILTGGGSFFTLDFVDYDGDEDLDLTTVDADGNSLIVLLNDGTGNFTQGEVTNLGATALETFAIAGADLDRDGNADYVAGGESGSPVVAVLNDLPDRPTSDSEMVVTAYNNFSISVINPDNREISEYEQTVAGSEYREIDFDNDDTLDTRTFDYNLLPGEYRLIFESNAGPGPTGGKLTATIGINGSQQYRLFQEYSTASKSAQAVGDTVNFYWKFETPSAIAPVSGLKTQSLQPAFQWKGVFDSVGVTKYHFQLDETHDLSTTKRFEDSSMTVRQYLAPSSLGNDSVFYWRVRAQSGGFWSEWSRTFAAYIGPGCCVGIRGNANNVGAITVADLTYLVSFLFSGGATPPCPNEANVNGAGGVTVADLTYLVNFLFNGGPQPPPCP